MYELRELSTSYLGIYLLVALTLFVILKVRNAERYHSIVFFWVRTSSNAELNKPFNQTRAFSIVGFILRSFVFGLMTEIFISKSLSANTINLSLFWWAGGYMLYWATKTLVEGGLVSVLGLEDGLLKIFYIRTIFKEKWAFVFSCLTLILIYFSLSEIASRILALSYLIGIVAIHLRFIKLYFKQNPIKKVYIMLYICSSEIGPLWLLTQTLKF